MFVTELIGVYRSTSSQLIKEVVHGTSSVGLVIRHLDSKFMSMSVVVSDTRRVIRSNREIVWDGSFSNVKSTSLFRSLVVFSHGLPRKI